MSRGALAHAADRNTFMISKARAGHLRSPRLRRAATGAVLASAMAAAGLAAATGPAGAVTGRADAALGADANPACPAPDDVARQAADRFSDIDADHTHAANIGCLVYYGITVGAGDGSYFDPGRGVNRWQMALFMTRAAKRADVTLPAGDQGFTDVDDLRSAIAAGVNAAAALGIMPGTSTTEFSPRTPVLRADMALYLVRLLELVTDAASPINVTVDDSTGAVTMTRRDGIEIRPDDGFDDVAGTVATSEEYAINAIYELGVTTGRSPGVYDPEGRVTRGQMAAFIIRLLGHSSLRPDGPIVLAPWEPPAPAALPADPDGIYSGEPLHLIAHASFERAYSLPGSGGDVLEVWLCNTPQSGRRYSTHPDNRHNPTNYATKFASQVTAWFEWLSDGLYHPVFMPGGVVDVGQSGDYYRGCDDAVLAQGRQDIDGAVVVVGTEVAATEQDSSRPPAIPACQLMATRSRGFAQKWVDGPPGRAAATVCYRPCARRDGQPAARWPSYPGTATRAVRSELPRDGPCAGWPHS